MNESVGAISNPIEDFEVGVNLADFEDNDYAEESTIIESDEEEENRESEDDRFDDGDELDSNDSALNDIRRRGRDVTNADARERELKRWIRNCRRECARRATAGN